MSRNIDANTLAEVGENSLRPLLLVEFLFSEPIRLAASHLTYELNGKTFIPSGDVISIGDSVEGLQLDPSTLDLSLSGLKASVLSAFGSRHINKPVNIYLAYLDANSSVIGSEFLFFPGLISDLQIQYAKAIRINITLKDELVFWARPKVFRYTDADQQRRHPGDRFFQYVESLSNKEIEWPA